MPGSPTASMMRSIEDFLDSRNPEKKQALAKMAEYKIGPAILQNVRVVDVEKERADDRPSDIVIEKGRVARIVPNGQVDSAGHKIIDGEGRFVMPGLIDCHLHISGIFVTELPGVSDLSWILSQIYLNHRAQLQSGVTLVRDMTSVLRAILLLRSVADDPCSGFPRVLCCGPMLTVEGGYPPYVPTDQLYQRILGGPLKLQLKDERDAAQWVDKLAKAGVDWIKVGYQSALFDVARTPMNKPSPELFKAIVERAHHNNLPVAVHHYWIRDLKELLDLPFDTLEHITEDGELDAGLVEKFAKRGLPITTDLEQSAFAYEPQKFLDRIKRGEANMLAKPSREIGGLLEDVIAGRDIYGLKPRRKIMDLAFIKDLVLTKMRNAKALSDGGVLVGAATDSGVHMMIGLMPDELCRLAAAGIKTAKVLRSATVDAAKLLRVDDVGRIREGYRADFVLYDANPLEDIEAVRKPRLVIRDGVPQIRR